MPQPRISAEEFARRFLAKVEHTPATGSCWLWTGLRGGNRGRYGLVWLPANFDFSGRGSKLVSAHHAAFFLAHGYWAEALRHTCDLPLCVNPDHLVQGSQFENMRDMVERGRARNQWSRWTLGRVHYDY